MKIIDALKIIRAQSTDLPAYDLLLACGFTPLHMQTLLAAHLQSRLPAHSVRIKPGVYGDLAGTMAGVSAGLLRRNIALIIEWPDLDPRLGFRQARSWGAHVSPDIVDTVAAALARIRQAVLSLAPGTNIAVCAPTLPLPPLFHCPGWQASKFELQIQECVAAFCAQLCQNPDVKVVSQMHLAQASPLAQRLDIASDLAAGLPYTIAHADAVAEALSRLLAPAGAKKGLITDLDNTLWHGIVGEVGPEQVSWDLDSHQQAHGMYQTLLGAFATEGVLIGVASKNNSQPAEQALCRADMLISRQRIYPVEIHWEPKSLSVARILKTWNISADAVVFVDDSPMELAEVKSVHPAIECVLFPSNNAAAVIATLNQLRGWFGKSALSEEDALRADSIRNTAALREGILEGGASPDDFLRDLGASLRFDFDVGRADARVLELINKTNQFNLNGIRLVDTDWRNRLDDPNTWLAVIGYEDKFGPLGKIAVVQGRRAPDCLIVDTWVMSCRAFSRRIEHQCLRVLFDRYQVSRIRFQYKKTAKNGPLTDFIESLSGAAGDDVSIAREDFNSRSPQLFHRVEII